MLKNHSPKTDNSLPILYFDGGSRGNPGEAAGAGVIVMPDGQKHSVSQYMPLATNNEAEYTGLVVGLQQAIDLGIQELSVKGDSQLVINQVNGKWKVNSPHLKPYYNQAQKLIKRFQKITIDWVRRNENHLADAAVNQCIDQGESLQVSPKSKASKPVEIKLSLEQENSVLKPKDKLKKAEVFPYAKGDQVVVSQLGNSLLDCQGVIISEPNCSQEGDWVITIKLENCPQINTDEWG